MKVAVLTSSRADYSIYFPLLKKMKEDSFFDLNIIAFGTHLSEKHGYTLNNIINDGFQVSITVNPILKGDSPQAISEAKGETIIKFSEIWSNNCFDLVICLGDRYEMFAAICATIPFNYSVAHIHGGETTLGAIDNAYRHSISLFSKFHFASTEEYKERVIEVVGYRENVFNVGALSIDNLKNLTLYTKEEFYNLFNIDLNKPTVLITFHPETVSFEKNKVYIEEVIGALNELKKYQLVITMPNVDTLGVYIREKLEKFIGKSNNAIAVESFGTIGYLTCMKYCHFMLGNTSSGFVEASFFPKYVLNLGDRQKGRCVTPNIFNCPIDKDRILKCVEKIESMPLDPSNISVYGEGNSAEQIINILKKI